MRGIRRSLAAPDARDRRETEREVREEGRKEGRRFLSTTEGEFIFTAKGEMSFRNRKRSGGGNSERDETDGDGRGTDGRMHRGIGWATDGRAR